MYMLIRAGLVYPVVSPPIHNGCVAIKNGVVDAVGAEAEFDGIRFDKVLDLSGHIVMPGFVNAHSHLQLSAARGRIVCDSNFCGWIRQVIEFNSSVMDEERERGMRQGIAEMLSTGTTSVGDIVSDAKYAAPLAASKLRGVVFVEAIAPLEKDAEQAADNVWRQVMALREMGIMAGVSPHAPHTVSRPLFRLLEGIAEKYSLPVTTHVAESAAEDEYLRNGGGDMGALFAERGAAPDRFAGYGVSAVQLLEGYGVLGRMLAVHLNSVNVEDMGRLSAANSVPVFCPGSSRWFGRELVMPLEAMFARRMCPALGTDSLASNTSLSMLDELRAAALYFPRLDRACLLEAATINGAIALGLECGGIANGKQADLISFAWDGKSDPLDFIFRAQAPDFVMIGGEQVLGSF